MRRVSAVIYVVAAVIVAAFCVANWALLKSLVSLNLLFAQVQTPVAVLLLLCTGVVLLFGLAVHASAEHGWRADRRKLTTEVERLRAQRTGEEDTRTQGLRATMEREFAAVRVQLERVVSAVQRLENDTVDAPAVPPSASDIDPELIPPRPAAGRGGH